MLQGHFEAWARNTNLIKGYVAGDHVSILYFGAHVLIAAVITASGALQLMPSVRARAASLHRWNGRFYILTAFLLALAALELYFRAKSAGSAKSAFRARRIDR